MATITSSSATGTPTPTSTTKGTSAVTKSAANELMTSLGSGSGVDTEALVGKLVDAQFASKRAQLTGKSETLTAQISGAAALKSTIDDFAKAVDNLVKGGTLATQPTSSDAKVAGATVIPGATVSTATTTKVDVLALATAQTVTSSKFATPASTTFGTGSLTLNVGASSPIAIAIDSTNNTLGGIAAAINASNAGVTASIVTDADGGAYLALKGQTGAAQAFTLTADDPAGPLAAFEVGASAAAGSKMTTTGTATNARLSVDGVTVERASNEVADLVPGVKLSLTGTGTATVGGARPDTALTNAVKDFVDTYNQVLATVKEQTDPITGKLRADPAARTLLRTLQGLTSRTLLPGAAPGSPSTLAAIGVRTNKDGTISVDETSLARAMKDSPAAIEQMFSPTTSVATGINTAMQSLKLNTGSSLYGLAASADRLRKSQSDLSRQQDKVDDQATRLQTRLTQQFSSMNSRVSAYKATQSFMKQQIDSWTKSA